jgi:hypothetical protein
MKNAPQSRQEAAGVALPSIAGKVVSRAHSFTFTAPLPPAECSPNHRKRWERIKAITQYRRDVGFCIAEARQAQKVPALAFERATLHLVFVLPDRRRHDCDNLLAAFKAGCDAIVDAELLVDDDSRHLSIGSVRTRVREPNEQSGVVVTLEALQ